MTTLPPPLPAKHRQPDLSPGYRPRPDNEPDDQSAFSVSAAKALFEAAQKPQVRAAAVSAAKNPVVRNAAVSAAKNPEVRSAAVSASKNDDVRNQLMAVLSRPNPAMKPQDVASVASAMSSSAPPPPRPAHRNTSTYGSNTAPPPLPPKKALPSIPSQNSYSSTTSSAPYYSPPNQTQTSYNSGRAFKPPTSYAPSVPAISPTPKPAYNTVLTELEGLNINTYSGNNYNAYNGYNGGYDNNPPPPPVPTYSPHNIHSVPLPHIAVPQQPKPNRPPPPSNTKQKHHVPVALYGQNLTEPHAVVKYPFTATQNDELPCEAGDTVILKKEVDDHWLFGMNTGTGAHGIIPLSFLDVRVPLAPTQKYSSGSVIATALYDYHSGTPGDLSFRVGDSIVVTDKVDNDWLSGECYGYTGIFPANFVDCPNLHALGKLTKSSEKMVAAYDYNSGVAGDLVLAEGDEIEIVERIDYDWVRGRFHGVVGLVPMSFLLEAGKAKKKTSPGLAALSSALSGPGKVVTAIADYQTTDEKHLYVSRGDRIVVTEDVDDIYYRGRLEMYKNFPPGLFPKNIVE